MRARAALHARGRKQGPCGLCGAPYARHRIWDAVDGLLIGGETVKAIVRWYPYVTPREVALVREAYADARRRHRPLPGRSE